MELKPFVNFRYPKNNLIWKTVSNQLKSITHISYVLQKLYIITDIAQLWLYVTVWRMRIVSFNGWKKSQMTEHFSSQEDAQKIMIDYYKETELENVKEIIAKTKVLQPFNKDTITSRKKM